MLGSEVNRMHNAQARYAHIGEILVAGKRHIRLKAVTFWNLWYTARQIR